MSTSTSPFSPDSDGNPQPPVKSIEEQLALLSNLVSKNCESIAKLTAMMSSPQAQANPPSPQPKSVESPQQSVFDPYEHWTNTTELVIENLKSVHKLVIKSKLPQLKSDSPLDYQDWKTDFEAFLTRLNLNWLTMLPTLEEVERVEVYEEYVNEIKIATFKLYSCVIQCLPTDLKRLIKSFSKKDGILALRTLESNILTPSAGRENYLRDKLKESTMTDHQDPNRFLSYIVRVCEELKQIGGTITDSEVENIILRKLPRSYDNLVKSYRRLEDEKKGLTFLMKDIKEEYELMRFRNPDLYQIRGRKTTRTHRANAVNTLEEQKVCWHCKKPGHFKRDCPERRNQQNEKKYTANLAQKKKKRTKETQTLQQNPSALPLPLHPTRSQKTGA